MTTELTQKLENIISGHSINEDDADWLRALTAAQPAQADAPRTCPDACKSPEKCCNFGCQKAHQPAQAGEVDERVAPYGYCPECGAPGVMRERRPDGDDKCSNGHRYPSRTAHTALPTQPAAQATPEPVGEPVAWRYKIPMHGGGTAWTHTRPQPECLIEAQPLYTHPAPGVPDGEPKLTQEELLEVAKHAWLMARTADSLQFYRTLLSAAAQAKGDQS